MANVNSNAENSNFTSYVLFESDAYPNAKDKENLTLTLLVCTKKGFNYEIVNKSHFSGLSFLHTVLGRPRRLSNGTTE